MVTEYFCPWSASELGGPIDPAAAIVSSAKRMKVNAKASATLQNQVSEVYQMHAESDHRNGNTQLSRVASKAS